MMNLRPHHRVHIPNTLAILAVVLLLISSVTSYGINQESNASSQQTTNSVKADNTGNESISTSASKKSRGLSLGFLLFRRG
jgi:CHASE3 domain sensor protein